MPWVLVCDSPDMLSNPPTRCEAGEHWENLRVEEGSGGMLPDLPLDDAASIGMAIAFLWVIAFAWREIRRAVADKNRE